MDKKGLEAKVLVELLLVIAGMIVLFLVYQFIGGGIKSGSDSEICRQSVLSSTVTKYVGLGEPWTKLKCKTKSKVIEGSKEKFLEEIQKDLKDCEYQYLYGKADFVNSWGGALEEIDTQCFVCYIDSPKDDLKDPNDKVVYSENDPLFIGVMIIKGGWKGEKIEGDFIGRVKNLWNDLTFTKVFGFTNIENLLHVITLGKYKGAAFYYQSFIVTSNELKDQCGDNINVFK